MAAGASGALNMAYDSDIDRLMSRTATRPIPMGHVGRDEAMAFGWSLAALAVAMMLAVCECAGGGAAGLYRVRLYRRLYAVAEAAHAAEHRHRRAGRGAAARHRLGFGDGLIVAGASGAGGDHLHVDAAAFLGPVAVALR